MENNNNFKPLQPEKKKEDTKFYNTYSTSKSSSAKSSSHSFGKSVMLPFFSGILGCCVVVGTCFGVPSIKEKIVGVVPSSNTSETSANTSTTLNSTSTGTVSQVNLANYSNTSVYAANKILPSIVGIKIEYTITSSMSMFGFQTGQSAKSTATASGSGIIISSDGYILTNNHVVDTSSSSSSSYYSISEASKVQVKLYGDEKIYDATIVGKDSQTDLAVLKIEANNLTAAEFANSDEVKVGEFAMAVGNPLGLDSSITCGVISAVNREVESDDGTTYTCIQTDAAINSGNSGGALVNAEGKVIGINTLKLSGSGIEGIGFSIPINSTINVTKELIEYNKVRRPYIGITGSDLSKEVAEKNKLVAGIYVRSVESYSPAEKAGLKIADVIVAVDGKDISTMDELNKIKNEHSIGDKITLKVYRDNNYTTIEVTLGETP